MASEERRMFLRRPPRHMATLASTSLPLELFALHPASTSALYTSLYFLHRLLRSRSRLSGDFGRIQTKPCRYSRAYWNNASLKCKPYLRKEKEMILPWKIKSDKSTRHNLVVWLKDRLVLGNDRCCSFRHARAAPPSASHQQL